MSRLLDVEDRFLKGPYKEEALSEVVDADSEYLQDLLDRADLSWEERSSIMGVLGLDFPEEEEQD